MSAGLKARRSSGRKPAIPGDKNCGAHKHLHAQGLTVREGAARVKAIAPDMLAKSILPMILVGRLDEPEEIGCAVVFLASDDTSFITGSPLSASGGQLMAYPNGRRGSV